MRHPTQPAGPCPRCRRSWDSCRSDKCIFDQPKEPLPKAGFHKDVTILFVGTGVLDGPRHILLRSKQIFNPDKFATKSVGVHYQLDWNCCEIDSSFLKKQGELDDRIYCAKPKASARNSQLKIILICRYTDKPAEPSYRETNCSNQMLLFLFQK